MTFRGLIENYCHWLSRDIDPLFIGMFRFWIGCICLVNFLMLGPDLAMWYSDAGVLTNANALLREPGFRFNLFSWFPDARNMHVLALILGVSGSICLVLGVLSRISALIVWLCLHSFALRNMDVLHSGDTLLRLAAFFLIFAKSGNSFSVDYLIRIFWNRADDINRPRVAAWPIRILQFQLCVLYFVTGFYKSLGSAWQNGSAVGTVLQLGEFQRFWLPDIFYLPIVSCVLSWMTLIFELGFPFLIWFRDTRWRVLLLGLMFHMGLEYTLNIQLFQWSITAFYILFLTRDDLVLVREGLRNLASHIGLLSGTVIFDGNCGVCAQTIKVLRCLDVFKLIDFVSSQSARIETEFPGLPVERMPIEMLAFDMKNGWLGGWKSCRWIISRIPVFWIFLPVLLIPGFNIVADYGYKYFASRRHVVSRFLGLEACKI